MNLLFISLGCDKNLVDTEKMLGILGGEGYSFVDDESDADVIVVNTCCFIGDAKEESVNTILEMAELKKSGRLKALIVTGCLAERYKNEITEEIPEVDAVLGTTSYEEIAGAIREALKGEKTLVFKDIDAPVGKETKRLVTTGGHYAFLKIAEGCDKRCTYCIIPYLRGRYRSVPMEQLEKEARELADAGVKELLVIAQDITRYGTDLNGEHQLASLLRELCRLDFHWVRLHYLYPDEITEELIDTIAEEPKIVKYLDIPIQHCNDKVLKAMNRRGDKAELLALFRKLRGRIPGLVLRTSLITGLPYEDEAAFEELCEFLQEVRIERAGVVPYSPEEGTPAARMLNRVDTDEAERRADLIVDVQSRIMDDFNDSRMGTVTEVLCDGFDSQSMMFVGRSYAESPDIDGRIYFTADHEVEAGEFVPVRITGAMDGELTGEVAE